VKRLAPVLLIALAAAGCERKPEQTLTKPQADEVLIAADNAVLAAKSPTLAAVRKRGVLRCGVNPGLGGFSVRDPRGRWRGFDVDICRAVAAAVLGDAGKVAFVEVGAADRFSDLKAGRIDLLVRNTSWNLSRDAADGVDFAGISYFDGQGFLTRRSLNLQSATELSGARICVQSGTTSALNVVDYFKALGLNVTLVEAASAEAARDRYQADDCDALTADLSALAAGRAVLNNPGGHVLLPEVISEEPMGPAVRQGDAGWTDIVRWTLNAMVMAEHLKLTSRDVAARRDEAASPAERRFLGLEGDLGRSLGLAPDWAFEVVRQVGSYGEIFDRNLGPSSGLQLARDRNALWSAERPGLLYAPPFR
jgi:general L-amino acid transport system substrate-binding protein